MPATPVSQDDFQAAVLDRSEAVPVVVDFWAPWCGPCRSFTPVLEAAADARAGRVVLVAVDTEQNPALAAYLNVHGIPAVKAFRRREVVAQFVGARAPAKVAAFFDRLDPSEVDELIAAGDEASLRRAVELDRRRPDAAVALARLLHARGDDADALRALEPVAGSFAADGLAARIRLAARATGPAAPAAGPIAAARGPAAPAAGPDAGRHPELAGAPGPAPAGPEAGRDPELADGLAALDACETARGLDLLLRVAARAGDRAPDVRQLIVSELDRLGFGHPLAAELRRRLPPAARARR